MKYDVTDTLIPTEKRKELNEKILYIIDNKIDCGITADNIAACYSGDGGLHGLNYDDFDSFHAYTKAKQIEEQGQFFTPYSITKFMVDCIKPSKFDLIADLTCGVGRFFNYLPVEENIYGCELDMKAYKVCKYLYPNANIIHEDIRFYNPDVKFDTIFLNPPFNLKFSTPEGDILSQLYCCQKSAKLLKPAGLLMLVVPNSFVNDEFADGGMIKNMDIDFNFICQFDLPANAFKNVGVNHFETKVMLFQKKSEHVENNPYNTSKIDIGGLTETASESIYNYYVKPLIEQKEKVKSKIFFENLHSGDLQENQEFSYKVKKLLYDIKRNPKTVKKYTKCSEYVNKFYTQKKPDNMEWKEWDKIKVTHNKVLSYLKKALKEQNYIERDVVNLVKTKYGLKLKAYSRKEKLLLNKSMSTKEKSFNDMVLYGDYPFEDKTYYKLVQRKVKEYELQTQPYKDMKEDENIGDFLDALIINDSFNDKLIKLNDIQKEDTNKTLQKKYGFLQWERGTGKTITGTAQALYRLKYNNINNVIVIAPSIAIKGTWDECMESYGLDYTLIQKLSDLQNIKQGQIVLMTLYVINKYKRQIKKMLKMNNKKYFLIFDESDAITSLNTSAYKSVLSCFRNSVKYKLLLTGTSTRNNINEFYGQLELLYNNSINMLSTVGTLYVEDRKTKELEEISNNYYMKPIPAYKEGFNLFMRSFSPEKITVFGIGKQTQDIYNSVELKELLTYTVITRTFEEVTGRKGYQIHQKLCNMDFEEKQVYSIIIKEFQQIEREYFKSTGNSRKDAGLRALHQLNVLLQACARFHTMKEYTGDGISTKFKNIIKHIDELKNERVAIGCITKKSVWEYHRQIQKVFPDRKIVAFTGEDVNIYQRKAIIKELKQCDNVILITTQQSLSCSLNIGFIDNIIIPELQWNDSRQGQYYFRFIRYDSTQDKNVYIYTYANSIESNLMKLIIVKEKINLFMKDQEISEEELQNKYGILYDISDMLLSKEQDEEGKSYIRWGEQKII